MQTFVLLPLFLFSRVPSDADIWRYGPEYNFVAEGKVITSTNSSGIAPRHFYIPFKCRPRDSDTLNCRFDAVNTSIGREEPSHVVTEHKFPKEPFDINFDRWGVLSLVVPQQDQKYLNVIRPYASQLNFGVDLFNKSDGAFNAMASSYLGLFRTLVKISHEDNNTVPQGYEIVPTMDFQKKKGEVMVIEKTIHRENCPVTSRSRIAISDTGFESYTENRIDDADGNAWFEDKIGLNLVSVLPAEEALKPMSENATTVGLEMIFN